MAFPLMAIPAGISAITGLVDLIGGGSKKKKQAQQTQQMLNNAPKFEYNKNPLLGYTSSPYQDMYGYAMQNILFNKLMPNAGLDLGDEFKNMMSQYINPNMAFWSFGAGGADNPMNYNAAGGYGSAPQMDALSQMGGGGGGMPQQQFPEQMSPNPYMQGRGGFREEIGSLRGIR